MPIDKVIIVSSKELCERFNNGPFASFEIFTYAEFLRNKVIENPEEWQGPPGTRSQYIRYYIERKWMLEVHQYLRPDGTFGASHMPEPKRMRHGEFIYTVPPKDIHRYTAIQQPSRKFKK